MANILYRQSTTATLPVATSAKGSPLTNLEIDGNMRAMNEDLGTKATTSYVDGQISTINTAKNASSGYAGLDSTYRIQFKNVAGTFTSLLSNTNTASRTYTLQDRTGVLADDTDLAAKASLNSSPTFTGSVTATSFSGNLSWVYIQSRPTTVSGYGITDAITTDNIGSQTVAIATNLAGGLGGSIPYQSGAGTTVMLANGAAGKLLQSNGGTLAPSWITVPSSGYANILIFSTVGTTNWTVPAGVTTAKVTLVGGGGGGGGGAWRYAMAAAGYIYFTSDVAGGGGGGGGGVAYGYIKGLTPGSNISVTVGGGGVGGGGNAYSNLSAVGPAPSTPGGNGATGGASSFGTFITAGGGVGGTGGNASTGGTGGAIGSISGSITSNNLIGKPSAGNNGVGVTSAAAEVSGGSGGTNTHLNYGIGGSGGGARLPSYAQTGGTGSQGIIVLEF